jgi:hypothetical protein
MPDDLVAEFLLHDHFVRVQPVWDGGPVESALRLPDRQEH